MPTFLLPHATGGHGPAVAAPHGAPPATRLRRLLGVVHRSRARALSAWRSTLGAAFVMLAIAVLFGRLPLPAGLDFGYRSCARNVALLYLVGALAGAPGLALAPSRIGPRLLAFTIVATASVTIAGGRTAAVSALWTALGVFYAARALGADERGRRRLLHGLGLLCLGVLARELWHDPWLPLLREERRLALVTEHPNTLGFALALLMPVLLGATARRTLRAAACAYATAGALVLLATFSRAAWLALGGSLLVLALASGTAARPGADARRRRADDARVASAALALVLVALAVVLLSRDRVTGDAQRLRILGTSWSLFVEHWPLGIGFGSGNLEPLFPARYLERNGESLFLFHSHDLYLDVLTGSGVAGGIAALLLFTALARVAWAGVAAARHRAARAEAAGHATSLGVFLVLGLVDMPLYHGRLLLLAAFLWAMMEGATDCAVRSQQPKKAASPGAYGAAKPSGGGVPGAAPGLLTR